jgi:hypothetical protein
MAQLPPHSDTLLTETDEHKAVPHDPKEINPKMASDIAYWAKEFHVSGQVLHEAIRVHGTHVEKVRAALAHHDVSLSSHNGEKSGDHSK